MLMSLCAPHFSFSDLVKLLYNVHAWLSCLPSNSLRFLFLFLVRRVVIIIALDENDRHIFSVKMLHHMLDRLNNVLKTISTQKQNDWVG